MQRISILCIVILVLSVHIIESQIPKTISYQGYLTNSDGEAVADGEYNLIFGLHEGANGGIAIWSEGHPATRVTNGVFNVILGEGAPAVLLNLDFDRQYWIEITVGTTILTPRIKLASSPYSLNANSVVDNAVTTDKIADDAVTAAKIAPNVVSSIAGVANDGGNVDLVPQNTITITPSDGSDTITIGETHSAGADNPHLVTAAQAGGLVSVEGVDNAGGNIDLEPGQNITIASDNAANTITISATDTTGDDWKLGGNAGASGSFLGTTDNEPLKFRVNNSRVLSIEPHATSSNIIFGFSGNNVTPGAFGAVISGGGENGKPNNVTDDYGVIGGGLLNQAGDGDEITNNNGFATVGGGYDNNATRSLSTIGGGFQNRAEGYYATVGGGHSNQATDMYATVCGGHNNQATGERAVVPGGGGNKAEGNYSFAAGRNANVLPDHHGSFVFADSGTSNFYSSAPDQFSVRCIGGVRFYTKHTTLEKAGVWVPSGSSAWSSLSDRHAKSNFTKVDGREALESLASISIETWNYNSQDPSIRHMGPMAQDFYKAFGLGVDDKHISTVDADGVALAAIQGLYDIVREKEAKINAVEMENAELKKRLEALEAIVLSEKDQSIIQK